ncbi:hypothetical protein ABGT15_10845 [Flavobacterium enshiense]|uniref:hypothetical protein n=1 Tax=Flavobacterium enshiense TaxID=1341165 RepID=UPI00345C734B
MKKFKSLFVFFLLLLAFKNLAQTSSDSLPKNESKRITYTQIDIALPLYYDPAASEDSELGDILPAGINAVAGFGYHYKKWTAIGFHAGINMRLDEKLLATPIFLNYRISPQIGEDTILHIQLGYGKVFALGRGGLSGPYKRINVGIGDTDKIFRGAVFLEYNEMRFSIHDRENIKSFSIGGTVFFL